MFFSGGLGKLLNPDVVSEKSSVPDQGMELVGKLKLAGLNSVNAYEVHIFFYGIFHRKKIRLFYSTRGFISSAFFPEQT